MTSMARSGERSALTPSDDDLQGVDIEAASPSRRGSARRADSIAIWKISIRFFSPPEKPTLRPRRSISKSILRLVAVASRGLEELRRAHLGLAARLALGVDGSAHKGQAGTPGISSGYWNGQEDAPGRPFVGPQRQEVLAVERVAVPPVTS